MDSIAALLGMLGAAIIAAVVAYMRGKSKGATDAKADIATKQADATINTTKGVHDAVEDSRAPDDDGSVPGWHDRLVRSKPPADK